MNVASLPASLTITNLGPTALGIANIIVPGSSFITVALASMGPARKCDVWLTAHAARLAGFVSTSPVTATLDDAWHSAHIYRVPPLPYLGSSGQGENFAPGGVVAPSASLDFSLIANSCYVAAISF